VLPNLAVLVLFFVTFAGYAATTGLIGPVYGDFTAKAILRWRGRFYGGAQFLGGIMGFGAGAMANHLLGALPAPAGIQACFWLSFGLSFISLVFIANLREVPYPDRAVRVPFRVLLAGIPGLLRTHPSYRWFLTGRSTIALGTMGVGFVAAAALDSGASVQDAASFASIYLLSQSLAGVVWGLIGDRWGWKLVLEAEAVTLAAGMLAALVGGSVAMYGGALALIGMSNAASIISDPNLTYEVAPPDDTSRYLGVTSTLIAPALAVAPLIGGLIAGLVSYPVLFGLAGVLAVVGLVTAHRCFEEPRRVALRTAAASMYPAGPA
jgi:MFS family permease